MTLAARLIGVVAAAALYGGAIGHSDRSADSRELTVTVSAPRPEIAFPLVPDTVVRDAPRATLLYQNFPNPFPSPTSAVTCLWFDLRRPGAVRLDIYSLRGSPVRTLVPGNAFPILLPAGRYGRGDADAGTGCDPRLEWDGTDDRGVPVPDGVYIARLRADGAVITRKMLVRGR